MPLPSVARLCVRVEHDARSAAHEGEAHGLLDYDEEGAGDDLPFLPDNVGMEITVEMRVAVAWETVPDGHLAVFAKLAIVLG